MKTYKIKVNGKVYEVEVEEVTGKSPAADSASAPAAPAAAGSYPIESPMQGIILAVKTPVGTAVKKGQILAILEAMKLENEIVSPVDGTVAQVLVKDGQVVDSGALILTISQ